MRTNLLSSVAALSFLVACDAAPPSNVASHRDELLAAPVSIPVDPDGAGVDLPAPGAESADADATYYVVLFGYQESGLFHLPRNSHTFATYVQVDGDDIETADLTGFTVSWLPQDGDIGLGQGIEPGRNYGLAETLAIATDSGFEVRRSRFTKIQKSLFDAARARKATLDTGALSGYAQYRMIDSTLGRARILNGQPGFTNCIHAVSDALVYANGALLNTGTKFGFSASNAVYDHLAWFAIVVDLSDDAVLADRLAL